MEINHTHNGLKTGNQPNNPKILHSKVESSPLFLSTMRFGEITPHMVIEGVPSDKNVSLRSSHKIDTYTLKAPLMQDIAYHKDYFAVPMQAILPLNWDKIQTAPKSGDDVPENASTVSSLLVSSLLAHMQSLITSPTASDEPLERLQFIWFCRNVFSKGSLVNYLGCNFPSFTVREVEPTREYNPDSLLEVIMPNFINNVEYLTTFDNERIYTDSRTFANVRDFWLWVDENIGEVRSVTMSEASTLLFGFEFETEPYVTIDDFNYSRLCAYQIVCHHFYSNDNVDYIYSADMYRAYMQSIINEALSDDNSTPLGFNWNGIVLPYDSLSGGVIDWLIDILGFKNAWTLRYLVGLFTFRRSLRFVDYFTGAKTRPVAVGDLGVAVNDGKVNVIDVSRNIQRQRYLNAVNRTGRKIEDYVKGLFGVKMDYDYHNPMWLGSTSDRVYAVENENTGSDQFDKPTSVTSTLKSNAERFAFEFDCDCYCVILGLSYFDIKRVYTTTTDKAFYVRNRYDMFIPEMQFIGDQPITKAELGIGDETGYFGYTTRDMQYKTFISRAVGGFAYNLPGWSFAGLNLKGLTNKYDTGSISPEFVRARPSEFDDLYIKLSYWSPAGYFHFIVATTNDISANRPMIMNPQIIG